jgi:hypothetical protein
MPFTFAHPAIILPLRYLPRKWVSMTGLVVGSIAPDFEKFFQMKAGNTYSHTLSGIFWFNLPLSLALSFVFHGFVRNSLIENLPLFLKKRLYRFMIFNWKDHFNKYYLIIILSIVIGAATHLFWDSFTHPHGRAIHYFPYLFKVIFIQDIKLLRLYKMISIASSLIGSLIVIHILIKLPPAEQMVSPSKTGTLYWLMVSGIVCAVLGARMVLDLHPRHIWDLGTAVTSAVLLSILLTSLVVVPSPVTPSSRQ